MYVWNVMLLMTMQTNIKLTWPYDWPLIRQTPSYSGKWEDCQFIINDKHLEKCDYWVVFQDVLQEEQVQCSKKNMIFIASEGTSVESYNPRFLSQFGHVITTQQRISGTGIHHAFTATQWFVNKSFDELMAISEVPKSKNISLICSDKQFTDGHKKRYEFCMRLKEFFGDEIDLFGRGIREFEDKWDVLAPYKYSIAIENQVEDHYFTEKLYDCYLAYTFPFYYGCGNISQYFDNNSMLKIDINNFEASVNTIDKILEDKGFYNRNLENIIRARNLYLNNYNIFPYIINFIKCRNLTPGISVKNQKVKPRSSFSRRKFLFKF
ncbi:MAG: putative glycosyltransferase [Mucilaginibacter sp.]|nr:putative glycosyltransferase [Mucilaginibacter sp.]